MLEKPAGSTVADLLQMSECWQMQAKLFDYVAVLLVESQLSEAGLWLG